MMDLPWDTHRGLIEPISRTSHIKRLLIKNFLQFITKLKTSTKPLLTTLLEAIKYDTRSTTGKNLRGIMLLCNKNCIDDISMNDIDNFQYFPRPEDDEWKTEMLNQMVDERDRGYLDEEEINWFNYLCTN